MQNEILSVKLGELDQKIMQLHDRIRICEQAGHMQVKNEFEAVNKECIERESFLYDEMKFSKSKVTEALIRGYGQIRQIIQTTQKEILLDGKCRESLSEDDVDEMLLLAEYSLDFAMEAVNRALLVSLYAIDAQMTRLEKEEEKI